MKLQATPPEEFSEYRLIPENDLVSARLSNVMLRQGKSRKGEEFEKFRWTFVVTEPGAWQGKEIWGETSTAFTAHPQCKAYNWAVALAGTKFQAGEVMDTDDLLGMPCRILITHVKGADGRTWMRVSNVLPPRQSMSQRDLDEAPF